MACHGDFQSAAETKSVDRRDDRFVRILKAMQDRMESRLHRSFGRAELVYVRTPRESGTRPNQYDRLNVGIVQSLIDAVEYQLAQGMAQPIDGRIRHLDNGHFVVNGIREGCNGTHVARILSQCDREVRSIRTEP